MTKIEFVLRSHKIKQVDLLEKSWELAIRQEKSKSKGIFKRGLLKQNIYKIVAGRCNPTVKTLQKISICINSILKDRKEEIIYTVGDIIGDIDTEKAME